jgi:hypothetical protein
LRNVSSRDESGAVLFKDLPGCGSNQIIVAEMRGTNELVGTSKLGTQAVWEKKKDTENKSSVPRETKKGGGAGGRVFGWGLGGHACETNPHFAHQVKLAVNVKALKNTSASNWLLPFGVLVLSILRRIN